jgi:hypothetical protein
MDIRYRKGFEDVIVAADDVVRHFQCHLIPTLSHYTAQSDVRFLFSQAVRNAFLRFFWDLQDHHEQYPGEKIKPPSLEVLEGYLAAETQDLTFHDLLYSEHLAYEISRFGARLKHLYDFICSKCRAGMTPTLIGYGPVEAEVGGKLFVNYDVDLLYRVRGQDELLIVPNPFVDPWVYRALVACYRKGLRARDMEPKIYIGSFKRYPIVVHREADDDMSCVRDLLNGYYAVQVGDVFPMGQNFTPGDVRGCKTCVYQRECVQRDRGEMIAYVRELRKTAS